MKIFWIGLPVPDVGLCVELLLDGLAEKVGSFVGIAEVGLPDVGLYVEG